MSNSFNTDTLSTLRSTITSLKALLQRFESTIHSASPSPIDLPLDPPNPLALLSDASEILKAQTTKLSLLILNKPFTPSEITIILKSLKQECFPSLMTAAELCPISKYTLFLHRVVRSSVGSTMLEYMNLLDDIPTDEHGVEKTRGRGTLASTGLIWQRCDFMVQLAELGIIPVAASKIEEYHGLLTDAIMELEEWKDGESPERPENIAQKHMPIVAQTSKHQQQICNDNDNDIDTNGPWVHLGDTSFMTEELKPLVTRVLKVLKLIEMLYPPLIKRRVRRFPPIDANLKDREFPTEQQAKKLDALIQFCERFSSEADKVAGLLYLHDEKQVEEILELLKGMARDCVNMLSEKWEGGEDEFTVWVGKWLARLEET